MRQFATRKELFKYLVDNKRELIDMKKSVVKCADVVNAMPVAVRDNASKANAYLYENDEEKGVLKRTIVANTYNWLDSHGDVHIPGIFTESIAQRGAKAPHLHDHKFELEARVGKPIKFYEKQVSWRELGQGKTGMTTALFMESEIRRSLNEKVYNEYKDDEIDQHSVAMRYIKIALAVNDEENYPKEYEEWQKHIKNIGNRAEAEKQGYFYAIYEAALIEVSAVLLGSNELTPTLGSKSQPPVCIGLKVDDSPGSSQVLEALEKLSKSLTI